MLNELKQGAARNPIWFGAVATITGVQGFFAWEFWGAISADPTHQLALRALGMGFVAGEVVALDMASRADLAQEPKRASTLRALWAVLALTTFSADLSALSQVLREGDAPRAAMAAQFDANQAHISDLETRIDRADDPFDNELLSVAAYDAAIDGKEVEIATARSGRARMWRLLQLQDQLTDLQTARAAAVEVAGWQSELDRLRRAPEIHATRPETGAVEFEPFAEMATGVVQNVQRMAGQRANARVAPEEVRASMAWVATIAMKLMLTFGVWVGLQRGRGTAPRSAEPETPPVRTKLAPEPARSGSSPPPAPPPSPPPPIAPPQRRPAKTATFNRRNQRFGR